MNRPLSSQSAFPAAVGQTRKSQDLQVIEVACLIEKNATGTRVDGEPELPIGYRHIRSAIGALLIVGRDYGF
jgi:hypothetical protein